MAVDGASGSAGSSSGAANIGGIDFSVRVLTTGHWPTYSDEAITLPLPLAGCETAV